MPKVELRSNETPEQLMRRFRKEVVKSKILSDVRRKRWFVSKSEINRVKRKKAARRRGRPDTSVNAHARPSRDNDSRGGGGYNRNR